MNKWLFSINAKKRRATIQTFKQMSFNKLLISMHSWISCVAMTFFNVKMKPRRKNNLTPANGLLFSFLLVVVYLNAKLKKIKQNF